MAGYAKALLVLIAIFLACGCVSDRTRDGEFKTETAYLSCWEENVHPVSRAKYVSFYLGAQDMAAVGEADSRGEAFDLPEWYAGFVLWGHSQKFAAEQIEAIVGHELLIVVDGTITVEADRVVVAITVDEDGAKQAFRGNGTYVFLHPDKRRGGIRSKPAASAE